jgi:hypothetical protein
MQMALQSKMAAKKTASRFYRSQRVSSDRIRMTTSHRPKRPNWHHLEMMALSSSKRVAVAPLLSAMTEGFIAMQARFRNIMQHLDHRRG